jgi:hypothetical protein
MKRSEGRAGLPFCAAAAAYTVLWAILMPLWYRYWINPDGVSYISIAQKYVAGDFRDAVNGYWSPLYSWLLMPFLAAGMEPLLCARVLDWILGLGAFGALALLAKDFALSKRARIGAALSAIPIVLFIALSDITPDLLFATLLLIYLYAVSRLGLYGRAYGLVVGMIGALAYLAKAYALPFFLAHVFLLGVWQFFVAGDIAVKRRVRANLLLALFAFTALSGTWISVLSAKYGKLTWATAGSYNLDHLRPGASPQDDSGLVPPPNASAVSAHEDPAQSVNGPLWRPTDSVRDFVHYLGRILYNVAEFLSILSRFSVLWGGILAVYILHLFDRRLVASDPRRIVYPLITIALFSSGYLLVLLEPRYLWLCCFLLLLMGGACCDFLAAHRFFTPSRTTCLIVMLVCSFSFTPLYNLWCGKYEGTDTARLAEAFRGQILPGQKIASDAERWQSFYLAFRLNAQYYGIRSWTDNARQVEADLDKWGIEHYLVWDVREGDDRGLPEFERVDTVPAHRPVLYSRRRVASVR